MKKNLFVLFFIVAGTLYYNAVGVEAASVKLNEKNFPEEYFRYYISCLYDLNEDGRLSDAEREKVTEINVGKYSEYRALYEYPTVHTLKGIEHFPNLEVLKCSGNALKKLDVSKNVKLREIYCYSNAIKSLDVQNNSHLEKLYCFYNEIKRINVTKNKKLQYLYCSDNKIKSIKLSKNRRLKELGVSDNKIKKIDVKKLNKLEKLFCHGNLLKKLDVTNNQKLCCLDCSSNKLNELNLKKNNCLGILYCYENNLTRLDLRSNKMLQYLHCQDNQLVTGNVMLPYSQFDTVTCSTQKKTIKVKKIGKYYYVPLTGINKTNEITNLSTGTITEKGIRLQGKKIPKKITYEYNMFTDGDEKTQVEIRVKERKVTKKKITKNKG